MPRRESGGYGLQSVIDRAAHTDAVKPGLLSTPTTWQPHALPTGAGNVHEAPRTEAGSPRDSAILLG